MKTIIEPFRIKMVEPLPLPSEEQRLNEIKKAHYNLFKLPSEVVTFDFLTDSGTGSMSANQWAQMMNGDESYAGSPSYYRFEKAVQDITGFEFVVPTHQGRAAEALLMKVLLKPNKRVIGNTHFDTTRANIEVNQGVAIDLPIREASESSKYYPFKGNMDLARLEEELKNNHSEISFVIMTVTNNSVGGQPVSMKNIREASGLAHKMGKLFFIDCARFAENAYFIKQRESGYEEASIISIVKEMFSYADGALMSAKKDAFGNIGGFLALKDGAIANDVRTWMVVTEGFPTYGGLAGRDLEALAVGLREILEEDYLKYRIKSTAYLGEGLKSAGFCLVEPFGGHAVYIDALKTLSHLVWSDYPGQSLSVEFYKKIGLRSVEVGSVMLGRRNVNTGIEEPALNELVRLAIPRRVYTQSHIDYIIESAFEMKKNFTSYPGYEFIYQAPVLRHFTAQFKMKS